MPRDVPAETTVTKTNTHDRLAVVARFPSGGSFRFSITRVGERLSWEGSGDPVKARAEMLAFYAWAKARAGETHGQIIDRVEALSKTCNSCGQLIEKMRSGAA